MKLRSTLLFAAASFAAPALLPVAAVPAYAANTLTTKTTTLTDSSTDASGNSLADYAGTYSGNILELTAPGTDSSNNFHAGTFTVYSTDADGNLGTGTENVSGTGSTSLTNGSETTTSQTLWHYFVGAGAVDNNVGSATYGHTLYVSSDTLSSGDISTTTSFHPFALGGLIVGRSENTFTFGRTGNNSTKVILEGAASSGVILNIGSNTVIQASSSANYGYAVNGVQNWTIASGKTLTMNSGTMTFGASGDTTSSVTVSGGGSVVLGLVSGETSITLNDSSSLTMEHVGTGSGMIVFNLNGSDGTNAANNTFVSADLDFVTNDGSGTVTVTKGVRQGYTGTVLLQNVTKNNFALANAGDQTAIITNTYYQVAGSTLGFSGFTGYFNGGTSRNLYLTDYVDADGTTKSAVKITNGSSGSTQTFSGKITGDGTWEHAATPTQNYAFTGDLTEFSGSFKRTSGGGSLTFGGADVAGLTTGSVSGTGTIDWGSSLGVFYNYSNDVYASSAITGSTKLTKQGAGTLTLTGDLTYTGATTVSAGTLAVQIVSDKTFSSQIAIGNGAVFEKTGAGTLNYNGGWGTTSQGKLLISEGTFYWDNNTADRTPDFNLEIAEGAIFKNDAIYKYHTTLSGEISGAGTLLAAVPYSENQGDGFRNFTLSGATANFTGEWQLETAESSSDAGNRRVNGFLNSSDGKFGGVVNFIDNGASASKLSAKLTLQKDMEIGGLKGTLSNTIVESSVEGGSALTINLRDGADYSYAGTVSNSITALTVTGSGRQELAGTSDRTGATTVSGSATLAVGNSGALGTGNLTLNNNATLDLGTVGTSNAALNLGNGTVTLSESASILIALSDYAVSGTYKLISAGGLSSENFTLGDNVLLSETVSGRSTVTLSVESNVLTLNYQLGEKLSLTWNGGADGKWIVSAEAADNGWTNNSTSGQTSFQHGDDVTFNAGADVKFGDDKILRVGSMTIAGTATFTGTGVTISADSLTINAETTFSGDGLRLDVGNSIAVNADTTFTGADAVVSVVAPDNLTISDGKKLTIGSGVTLDLGSGSTIDWTGKIAGSGTVKIVNSNTQGHWMTAFLGSDFHGVLDWTGRFNWSRLTTADDATIRLSTGDDSNSSMWCLDTDGTFAQNFEFAEDYKIATDSANLTLNGNVSADGKTLTVSGDAAHALTLNGTVTIGTLSQTSGTLNVSGATTISGNYTGGNNSASTINVQTGGDLNVQGNFTLHQEYNQFSTLNVAGTMKVGGELWIARDGMGDINVNDGGTLTAGTLKFGQNAGWSSTDPNQKHSYVNVNAGGTLAVGAVTATTTLNTPSLNLNGGTLGTTADSLTIGVANLPVVLGDGTTSTVKTSKFENGAFGDTAVAITISDVISGSGALTADGAGTLTLSGENTFTGGAAVSGGTLKLASAASAGAGTLTANENGTLELAFGGDFSKDVSGTGTLAKSGADELTYSGAFSGFVHAKEGVLNVSGMTSGAALTIDSGATFKARRDVEFSGALNGAGTLSGQSADTRVSVASGAFSGTVSGVTLAKTGTETFDAAGMTFSAGGTLSAEGGTIENLTLSSGAALKISGETAPDGVTLNNLVLDGGVITLENVTLANSALASINGMSEVSAFTLNLIYSGVVEQNTAYTLFTFDDASKAAWETAFGPLTDIGLFNENLTVDFGGTYKFSWAGNDLNITMTGDPQELTWTAGTGTWNDKEENKTWSGPSAFVQVAKVTFDETSLAGAEEIVVTLEGSITATSVRVNVGAAGSMELTGADDVSLRVPGGIDIESGTLKWNLAQSSYSGDFSIGESGTLQVMRDSFTLANRLSGAGTLLYAQDGGSLTLSGDRSGFTGTLNVAAGTVVLARTSAETESFAVTLSEAGTLKIFGAVQDNGYTKATATNVSGAGTLVFDGGQTESLTAGDAAFGGLYLAEEFAGTVELRNVNLAVVEMSTQDRPNTLDGSDFGSAGKIVLNNAALNFTNTGATFEKNIEVAENATGYIRAYGDNTTANNAGVTIAGNVSGAGTLEVRDGGEVAFTGTDFSVGALTVNGGTTSFTGTNFSVTGDAELGGASSEISYETATIGGNLTANATAIGLGGKIEIGGDLSRGGGDWSAQNSNRKLTILENAEVSVAGDLRLANATGVTIEDGATLSLGSLSGSWGIVDRTDPTQVGISIGQGSALNVSGAVTFSNGDGNLRGGVVEGAGTEESKLSVGRLSLSGNVSYLFRDLRFELAGIEDENSGENIGISGTGESYTLKAENVTFAVQEAAEGWTSTAALKLNGGTTTFDVAEDKTITLAGAVSEAQATATGTEGEDDYVPATSSALVKTGAGTLVLRQANTNAGGTRVSEGTLKFEAAADASDKTISLASGEFAFETGTILEVGAGTTLGVAGATLSGDVVYSNEDRNGSLEFASDTTLDGSLTLRSTSAAAKVTLADNATLTLNTLAYSADSTRAGEVGGYGTLSIGGENGGLISAQNRNNNVLSANLNLTSDTTVAVGEGNRLTIGSEEISANGHTLTKTGLGMLTFSTDATLNFDGSADFDAGTVTIADSGTLRITETNSFRMGAGATFNGNLELEGAGAGEDERVSAAFGGSVFTGNLSVENTALTFGGTLSGVSELVWKNGNTVNLTDEFRAGMSGTITLISFRTGKDADGNALSSASDFGEYVGAPFLGRDVEISCNEANGVKTLDLVVTGTLRWNADVKQWDQNANGDSPEWDGVTKTGTEKTAFRSGDYVEFADSGSMAIKGTRSGTEISDGKILKTYEVRTTGMVFNIADDNGSWFHLSLGSADDDGTSTIRSSAEGDEGLTVLAGDVTIGKGIRNELTGGTYIYGGSLTVSGEEALGGGKVVVGSTLGDAAAALNFDIVDKDNKPVTAPVSVSQQIELGNSAAVMSVGNNGTVVIEKALKKSENAVSAALTKKGAGTLSILRDSELDALTVSAGALQLAGAAETQMVVRRASVASGATLAVLNGGGDEGATATFESLALGGSLTVGGAGTFRAGTIAAEGSSATVSGALFVGGETSFNTASGEVLGTAIDTGAGALAFTGSIGAYGTDAAALHKLGRGTLTLRSSDDGAFRMDAAFTHAAGTVSFASDADVKKLYAVTGGAAELVFAGAGENSFAGGFSVAENADVKIRVQNRSADLVFSNDGDASAFAAKGSVTFAGGTDNRTRTVGIANASQTEGVSFGNLAVGGIGDGNGVVALNVESEKFAAGSVAIGAASVLKLSVSGEATASSIKVESNRGQSSVLDLSGVTTLELTGSGNVSVLDGDADGTLEVRNGTLSVSGRNYYDDPDEQAGPTIALNDATFDFEVAGEETAFTTLQAIRTVDGTGTVSKSGRGTLVLATTDAVAFDGDIALNEGATHLYSAFAGADVSVASGATLRLFGHVSTAADGSVPLGDGALATTTRLAESLSGTGTIEAATSGILFVNRAENNSSGLENFEGALAASDGAVIAATAVLGDWLAGGNSREVVLRNGGALAAVEKTALTQVSVEGSGGALIGTSESAALTVSRVDAASGSTLELVGVGELGDLAFGAVSADGVGVNTLTTQNSAKWTLTGTGENIAAVELNTASTLTVAHKDALAGAAVSVSDDAELVFAADGAYGNAISVSGSGRISAAEGKAVTLTTGTTADSSGIVFFTAGEDAALTLGDFVFGMDDAVTYLVAESAGRVVVDIDENTWLDEQSTRFDGNVMLRGAGTAEFSVASGKTLRASGVVGRIGEFAVTGEGTVSFASDAELSVAEGGAGTLSVAESATVKIRGANLSEFTLTGAGAAEIIAGGRLAAISEAENVSLESGTLDVAGDVKGSKLAFDSGAKLSLSGANVSVSGTELSGETVTLVNAGTGSQTYDGTVAFADGVKKLALEAGWGKNGGVIGAAFSGSLEKTGDGLWTVTDYTLGASADESLTVSSAGTLVWENAKFGASSAAVTLADTATLRISKLGGDSSTLSAAVGGTGTLEISGTGTADVPLTLDTENTPDDASWALKISGGSHVKISAALPGSLELADAGTVATVSLAGADDEMAMTTGEPLVVGTGTTLVKAGAGTLTVANDSETALNKINGVVEIEEGRFVQSSDIRWISGSEIRIGEAGTFEAALSGADGFNNAVLSGAGTFRISRTAAEGYTLSGVISGFAGTVDVASGARLNLDGGTLFGAAESVNVAGTLAIRHSAGGALENVSGDGVIEINAKRDGDFYKAVYGYDGVANAFTGKINVVSGALALKTDEIGSLRANRIAVGVNSDAAEYSEYQGSAGLVSGAFLKLENSGVSAYDVAGIFENSKLAFDGNAGVIFAAGKGKTFEARKDFGTGGLFVTEKDSTLKLGGNVSVNGDVFVAQGSTLETNVAASAETVSATAVRAFADGGNAASGVDAVTGSLMLNGTLICRVTDATAQQAQLNVGKNVFIANAGGDKAEIQIDVSELTDKTLSGGMTILSYAKLEGEKGSINKYVSVVDTSGAAWIVKASDDKIYLAGENDYAAPGNLSGLYEALRSADNPIWDDIEGLDGSDMTAALVALSPVSFGALVEMQSGFASLENDLLRERLEQRRYERAFASDRGVQFKPFVNALGADREGDGNGTESANYDITHYGAVGGFDVAVSPNTIFGVSLGVDWAKADLHYGAGKHEADSARIGVYGMSVFGNAYFGYGLSAGGTSFDTKRRAAGETLTGSTSGNDVNASLLFGMGWTLDEAAGIDLAPYVGIDIGYAHADSFTEDGGSEAALAVDSLDRWSLRGKIGATLSWRATESLRIGIDAAFAHEFLDSDLDVDAKFASGALAGTAFSSKAYLMDENTIQIGPRIDFRINDTWSVSAAYTFETDLDDTTTHSANVGLRARF